MTHDTHPTPTTHTHTPPQIWGDVKKTSPKKLHPMAQTNRQTDTHTHGHGDSMTDPAQRAESVKKYFLFLSGLDMLDASQKNATMQVNGQGPKKTRGGHNMAECSHAVLFIVGCVLMHIYQHTDIK